MMFCPVHIISFVLSLCMVDATLEVYDHLGKMVDTFPDREAAFDDDFVSMEGFIVAADPPDACSSIAPPAFLTNFTMGKFVLVNGSDTCLFNTKIRHAEEAGYDVAVMFDPPFKPDYPFPFLQSGIEINIQVVFISYVDAIVLRSNYLYNNSYQYNFSIRLRPNLPDITYYMYLFGAVIGVCFFVMLLFMMCLLIKCIQEKRRSMRNRLSRRQIKQIPTAKFAKGDQYDVCAICLEDYNDGDKLRILPCSHAYHSKCIDPWLMNNRRNCPLCKRKITFGDSGDESDSEDSELTSPAENTPLLTTTSSRSQTWGTFGPGSSTHTEEPTPAGPASMPNVQPSYFRFSPPAPARESNNWLSAIHSPEEGNSSSTDNPLISADESESLLPPMHGSVNRGNPRSSRSSGPIITVVDVAGVTPDEVTPHRVVV